MGAIKDKKIKEELAKYKRTYSYIYFTDNFYIRINRSSGLSANDDCAQYRILLACYFDSIKKELTDEIGCCYGPSKAEEIIFNFYKENRKDILQIIRRDNG
jgi:hypothetical protein